MQIAEAVVNIGNRRNRHAAFRAILIVTLRCDRLRRAVRKGQRQRCIRHAIHLGRTGDQIPCLVADRRNRRHRRIHVALVADRRRCLRPHAAHGILDFNSLGRALCIDATVLIGVPTDNVVTRAWHNVVVVCIEGEVARTRIVLVLASRVTRNDEETVARESQIRVLSRSLR